MSTRLTRTIAARLAEIRARKGLSQEALARKAKLQRVSVGRIELGVHEPSITTLEKLAKALGVRLVIDFK